MGLMLVGFAIAGLVGFAYYFFTSPENRSDDGEGIIIVTIGFVFVIGCLAGLLSNTNEYGPIEEVETVRICMFNDTGYVKVSPNDTYEYCIEAQLFNDKNAHKYVTLSNPNVAVVEEENCAKPRLVKYMRKQEPSFWTFALGTESILYFMSRKGQSSLTIWSTITKSCKKSDLPVAFLLLRAHPRGTLFCFNPLFVFVSLHTPLNHSVEPL